MSGFAIGTAIALAVLITGYVHIYKSKFVCFCFSSFYFLLAYFIFVLFFFFFFFFFLVFPLQACFRRINESSKVIGTCDCVMEI